MTLLPVTALHAYAPPVLFRPSVWRQGGAALTLIGFYVAGNALGIETVADLQKFLWHEKLKASQHLSSRKRVGSIGRPGQYRAAGGVVRGRLQSMMSWPLLGES